MRWLPLCVLAGCVVSVDPHVTVDEAVDTLRVHLANGDLSVTGRPGKVTIDGAIGGPSRDAPAWVVEDGVLTVDVSCRVCGGRLELGAPPDTRVLLVVEAGSAEVRGMAADVDVDVDFGDATVAAQEGGEVTVSTTTGSADLELEALDGIAVDVGTGDATIALPAGGYALDLAAPRGALDVSEALADDPAGPVVHASVRAGDLSLDAN